MKLFQRRARSIPKAHHCTSAVSIHDHVHANDSHCTIIVQAETMPRAGKQKLYKFTIWERWRRRRRTEQLQLELHKRWWPFTDIKLLITENGAGILVL